MKKRVFSGMRPTGPLHLGHLVGALDNWVQMQDDFDCVYGIVDWHALTTEYQSVEGIQENVLEIGMDWMAAGLDPERSVLMVQSLVPEHAELQLLLGMICPLSWLERVPTYKEQKQQLKGKDLSTLGFLGYPLLQAADILIYRGEVIPVGEDQVSHIELTREVARRFNHLYGKLFPEPQARLTEAPRLPGTDGRKMSKSYGNEIQLSDTPAEIKQKIMTMKTDPARARRTDPGNPEICPVFDHHKIFTGKKTQKWVTQGCKTAGIGCADCKQCLLEGMLPVIQPVSERRKNFQDQPEMVREILMEGSRKARRIATETIKDVRQSMRIGY